MSTVQEGNEVKIFEREYKKKCKCKNASASGPRAITRSIPQGDGKILFKCVFTPMACDKCDTEWEMVK